VERHAVAGIPHRWPPAFSRLRAVAPRCNGPRLHTFRHDRLAGHLPVCDRKTGGGKISVNARGSESAARSDENRAHLPRQRPGAREAQRRRRALHAQVSRHIDRTYSDLAALSVYQELSGLRHEPMAKIRDLRPDDIRGRDLMLADSLTNEFSAKLLTADRIEEMIRISAPTK
jgi:hypothetical protein